MIGIRDIATAVALAASLASSAAFADGMPRAQYAAPVAVEAPFNWTGIYFGVNAGYASASSNSSSSMTCPDAVSCGFVDPGDLGAASAGGSGSMSSSAFTGGVQAGYNMQHGNIVVGVETDFDAFGLKLSRNATGSINEFRVPDPFVSSSKVTSDWLFTARLRAGWTPVSNVLIYATGGLAVTDLQVTNQFTDSLPPPYAGTSSHSSVKPGWVLGGGVEWALNQNWTLKGEYLYVDFGSVKTAANVVCTACRSNNTYTTNADLTANIGRVGLNYKF